MGHGDSVLVIQGTEAVQTVNHVTLSVSGTRISWNISSHFCLWPLQVKRIWNFWESLQSVQVWKCFHMTHQKGTEPLKDQLCGHSQKNIFVGRDLWGFFSSFLSSSSILECVFQNGRSTQGSSDTVKEGLTKADKGTWNMLWRIRYQHQAFRKRYQHESSHWGTTSVPVVLQKSLMRFKLKWHRWQLQVWFSSVTACRRLRCCNWQGETFHFKKAH